MKKVVDANYLSDPDLEQYLLSDTQNKVVFTDYACMEAYKGNPLINLSKSLQIVSKFPNQVVILKGTRDVVKLTLLPNGIEFIEDVDQTRYFSTFCQDIKSAIDGNSKLQAKILENGKIASDHFKQMQDDSRFIISAIYEIIKSLKSEHFESIRKKEPYSSELIDNIITNILIMAMYFFRHHPDVEKIPNDSEIPNTYILRYSISCYLLTLKWISDGGPANIRSDRFRNDIIDMSYVAYATFFDGLLSRDKKMIEIYEETCFILKNIFIE